MLKTSIVIRCFNEEQHIGRLLSGINRQRYGDVEIILVDSGSTDATLSIASRFPVKIVQIAASEFSFGRSLNRGCAAASGDILVFASAHVYPLYDDWLERLVRPFNDPAVALSYGGQRGVATTKYSEHQIFARWFPDCNDPDQSHPFCNNANAAILRTLWEQNPYDETLTGLEDIDWAQRIVAAGHKIAYVGEAVIAHVHNESPNMICNRYRREAIAMKRLYPAERFTALNFVCLLSSNILSDLYHAARERVLFRNAASIFVFRVMQFAGTYQGYRLRGPVSGKLRQTFYYPRGPVREKSEPRQAHNKQMIDYSTG